MSANAGMCTQSGPDYYVEVDVVMGADTPLWKAHDLAQNLQDKIEVLPNVGRAFVHVDHETTHHPVRAAPLFLSSRMLIVAWRTRIGT